MKMINKSVYNFSKENSPFITVDAGELLLFQTLDCFSGQIKEESNLMEHLDLSVANPAAGPVYVNGAMPGDVLAADILDIQVDKAGIACSMLNTGPLCDESEVRTKVIPIEDGRAVFNDVSWLVEPMVGVIGTAPGEGSVPCGFAGNHGGNLDSKLITKGARVYLPVRHEGGLFQLGDLHASMGDGEVCGTGIEIAGEVLVRLTLIKRFELNWPVTETGDRYYVNSVADNYDEALIAASKELCRLMKPVYNWDSTDILIYLSIQGDVEVNQTARPAKDDMYTLRFGIPKLSGKKPLVG